MNLHKKMSSRLQLLTHKKSARLLSLLLTVTMIMALCVPVTATTAGRLQPDRTNFDKNTQDENYKDIQVTYQGSLLSVSLVTKEVNSDGAPKLIALREVEDYILNVTNDCVTLKKEYLETLEDGVQTLVFGMEDGEEQLLLNVMTSMEKEDTVSAEDTTQRTKEAASEEQSEGDWNYKLDLKWLNSPAGQEQDRVFTGTSRTDQSMTYRLTVNVNNVTYGEGKMEIRIPQTLWRDRKNNAIVPTSYGIPLAPGVQSGNPFNYKIDTVTDEIVIKNHTPVSTGNYIIDIVYTVTPWDTISGSRGEFQATGRATDSASSEPEEVKSQQVISYTMTTGVEISKLTLTPELLYCWNAKYAGTMVEPDDFDQYRWVGYYITAAGIANQPYTAVFTVDSESGGELMSATNVPSGFGGNYFGIVSMENGTITTASVSRTGTNDDGFGKGSSSNGFIYLLVRYPKNAENNLTLNVKEDLIGIDRASSTKFTSLPTPWVDYNFVYTGNLINILKEATGYPTNDMNISKNTSSEKNLTLLQNGIDATIQWSIGAKANLYNGDLYNVELIDDFMDWRTSSGTYVQMQPEDYVHKAVKVSAEYYYINQTNGKKTYYEKGEESAPEVQVWALIAGKEGNGYQLVESVLLSELMWVTSSGGTSTTSKTISLPEKTYQVKTTIEGVKDYVKLTEVFTTNIKASSPTLQGWFEDDPDLSSVQIRNLDGGKLYNCSEDEWIDPIEGECYNFTNSSDITDSYKEFVKQRDIGTYENYMQRQSASSTMKSMIGKYYVTKLADKPVNDTVNQRVSVKYYLSAQDYYAGLTAAEVTDLKEMGFDFSREEAVFYDLLPLGAFYDVETAPTVYDVNRKTDTVTVQVEKILDDYKGTGRQMVIFRVNTVTPGINYTTEYNILKIPEMNANGNVDIKQENPSSAGISGFTVTFNAITLWENISVVNNSTNLMAYQVPDSLCGDIGYVDNGAYNNSFTSVVGADGMPVFYNLKGAEVVDETIKNTMCATANVSINVAISAVNGLTKSVRAIEDGANSAFKNETLATVGSQYTYRLKVVNTENSGNVKGIVLYDILEEAANTGANEVSWKGTFDEVDLKYATTVGAQPIVYYSTESGLTYSDIRQDIEDTTPLSSSLRWSTTIPSDKTTITAVAVDLSKKIGGSEFQLGENEGISVDIKMNSPVTQPDAKYAYNSALYYSNFIPTAGGGSTSANECSRTRVEISVPEEELYDFTITKNLTEASAEDEQFVFEITYTPLTGEGFSFYQVLMVPKDETSVSLKVKGLAPGTYTVKELASNWRYSIQGSDTQSITLNDLEAPDTVSFTNKKTKDTWVSGKASLPNPMPSLADNTGE